MRPKSGHGRLEMIRHIFCKYYLGGKWRMDWKWKWKSLSHVQLFVTPWTRPWNYTGQNVGVGSLSLLQGIFPTQRPNPGLPHCRLILYQLSHRGSPSILEWEAYPFTKGSSWPRNQIRISWTAANSLPTELSEEWTGMDETQWEARDIKAPKLRQSSGKMNGWRRA